MNTKIHCCVHGYFTMYNTEKGYGFVHADDDNDYFVHVTRIQGEPARKKNCKILSYRDTPKGRAAMECIMED